MVQDVAVQMIMVVTQYNDAHTLDNCSISQLRSVPLLLPVLILLHFATSRILSFAPAYLYDVASL